MIPTDPASADMHASNMSSQQYSLLTSNKTQRMFEQLKDDSTSLVVLHDTASFQTRRTMTTTTTSKLSMEFTFDAELLQHKLYKSTLKSLMRRVGTGSGRALGSTDQFGSFDELQSVKTSLETDSLAASKMGYAEVRVLAIVEDDQKLLHTLQQIGGFIFEDKKRIRRERMVRWAMMQIASTADGVCRYCSERRIYSACQCTRNTASVREDLHDLYSRPGYLLPRSIEATRRLLLDIDKEKFAASRQGDARFVMSYFCWQRC